MKTTQRFVDGTSGLDTAERVLLLQAAMRAGRQVAGGVAHDLNSALQCLGDALFVLREDLQRLGVDSPAAESAVQALTATLGHADSAFERLRDTTRIVPHLIPGLADETGPVDLGTELRAVVATTRHHWKGRLEISVEAQAIDAPFWCTWWIARLAMQRMLLLAVDAQQSTPSPTRLRPMRLRLIGTRAGDEVEVRAVLDVAPPDEPADDVVTPNAGVGLDSVLCLCATHLRGEVTAEFATPFDVAFRFPVRSGPTINRVGFR